MMNQPTDGPGTTLPDAVASSESARDAIRERLGPVVSGSLRSKSVVIVGAGSGGSQTAEALVRSGIEQVVIIDPDAVETPNISRAVYTMRDIGDEKVTALQRRLSDINPQVNCRALATSLQGIPVAELDEIISSADLVIGATDDPAAQRLLNHFAYHRKIPAMFAGMYARGHGGEVIFTVPGITRCYECATAVRHQGDEQLPGMDYGTGRLMAEPALGADILHVVTASVKIALALLEVTEEGENVPLRDFMMGALERGYNYLIMSTVPDYGFFPQLFGQVAGQYAYQSAWLLTKGNPDCGVCGLSPVDPMTVRHGGAPDLTSLQELDDPGDSPDELDDPGDSPG
jgi:hypothetical protein